MLHIKYKLDGIEHYEMITILLHSCNSITVDMRNDFSLRHTFNICLLLERK